jgi:hypothetical protein
MAFFRELSEYEYHRAECNRPVTKNVGWLGEGHEFRREKASEQLLDRLWSYCHISVAQMRGIHPCEFCPPDGLSYFGQRNGEKLLLGSSEIRVFGKAGVIYAAPTLIYHYAAEHDYRPPDEFVEALLNEPAPPSPEYFDRLEQVGLEWNKTSVPQGLPSRVERNEAGELVRVEWPFTKK